MRITDAEVLFLESEPGHFTVHAWQNIMVVCWSKHGTGPTMQKVVRLREEMDRRHPEGVSVVYLIAHASGLPDAEARAEARQLMDRFSDRRPCLGVVIYGHGFWVSAMRAATTGVRLLTQRRSVMEIFSDETELVAWLPAIHERQTGTRVEPEQLLDVLQRLSAAL